MQNINAVWRYEKLLQNFSKRVRLRRQSRRNRISAANSEQGRLVCGILVRVLKLSRSAQHHALRIALCALVHRLQ
jgi:hypothetical protein